METKKELKTYQWKGRNKLGKEISGENDAKNDAVLKAFLAKQGLVNVSVKEKPKPLFESKGKIKSKDILFFTRQYDGAVIGAIREAMNQIESNINGLSVGGKIGIARNGEHLGVAIFLSVGILQFNEVICAVAHRSIAILPNEQEGGI